MPGRFIAVRGAVSPATSKTKTSLERNHSSQDIFRAHIGYHSTPTIKAEWKKTTSNIGEDEEQPELSCAVDRSLNWYNDLI